MDGSNKVYNCCNIINPIKGFVNGNINQQGLRKMTINHISNCKRNIYKTFYSLPFPNLDQIRNCAKLKWNQTIQQSVQDQGIVIIINKHWTKEISKSRVPHRLGRCIEICL